MTKTFFKIFIIILISISTINFLKPVSNAYDFLSEVIQGGKNFVDSSDDSITLQETQLQSNVGAIYNALLFISFVVVAVVGIVLGIKFMTVDPEQKADAKKSLYIFFIGTVVVYGSFTIWKVIVEFLNTVN